MEPSYMHAYINGNGVIDIDDITAIIYKMLHPAS